MPRFPWKAGLGPVPAVVLGHGAAWRVRTSGFVCSWSAALVLCSQFGVKTALNSQNMCRLLLRCFPYISGIVFSGSIAGEGQKSTRLQGWEDGGGIISSFPAPPRSLAALPRLSQLQSRDNAACPCRKALAGLETSRARWKDVPKGDRGACRDRWCIDWGG